MLIRLFCICWRRYASMRDCMLRSSCATILLSMLTVTVVSAVTVGRMFINRPAMADSSLGRVCANCFQHMRMPSSLIGKFSIVVGCVCVNPAGELLAMRLLGELLCAACAAVARIENPLGLLAAE